MKKLFKLFIPKQPRRLMECTTLEIKKEESDLLFGGYREDEPPIYEQETPSTDYSFKTTELLPDINQIKK